jgi:Protein of unknown function (DUF1214)
MGETPQALTGPDWEGQQLARYAYIDNTTDGFTELRVHGVSGPPPDRVLDYPAPMVDLVRGNATSGFWRRWRLGGTLEDVPDRQRMEAFVWGGLTSRASQQALWLPLLPFSLINLAHWMLPPYTRKDSGQRNPDRGLSYVAVSLLRVLGLSFTVTLALAGAEVVMDLVAWQCGANAVCLPTLQRHDPLGRLLGDPGPRVAIAGGLLLLVLLVLLLAGNARFQPLRDSVQTPSPAVPRDPAAAPVLGDPDFWAVDHSTRWLRCLHAIAWCTTTGAVATGALADVRPPGNHNPVGVCFTGVNLAVLVVVFVLAFWQRFGRGGKPPRQTRGYRWVNLAAVGLLVASLTVTAVYMPVTAADGHPALPYVQGAFGWLTFGQAVTLGLLAGCVGRLAWRLGQENRKRAAGHRTGTRPWGPLLGGMLTLVMALLGWLLGLTQSAGYGRWVADRLRIGTAAHGISPVLPNFYAWVDAYAILALILAGVWAGYLACRVMRRTRAETTLVLAQWPAEPGTETPTAAEKAEMAEKQARARYAARYKILAQSVETVAVLIAAVALASFLLIPCYFVHFTSSGPFKAVASYGAWVVTAGTAGLIVVAYAAFRNQSTRRIVGILWDVTTFWPRANHPLTPPCSAQRAVPQLADRIEQLTANPSDFLVLSAHSQGTVLAAAAVLRLAQDKSNDGKGSASLGRMALLTYGSPLRRLYARSFPAYFAEPVLTEVWKKVGTRWLNLWSQTDPIGAAIALPSARIDWQMLPDPLTLDVDPRTGEPVSVCDHSGYLARPEYPPALEFLRRLPAGEEYPLTRRDGETLNGSWCYVLRMAASQLPANGAWSVTLYDELDDLFSNALMRFSLGSAGEQPAESRSGDIDIYVQASPPPPARQANWLPAPAGRFRMVLRVDWWPAERPQEWAPPFLDVAAELPWEDMQGKIAR